MNTSKHASPWLSVSTWSMHRALGQPSFYGPERGQAIPAETHGHGAITLLDAPARAAGLGIHSLELCHFHLPSRDPAYLAELRAALAAADVTLFSLLIDAGDITHPADGERDLAWIEGWIATAAALGARHARVIAGKSASTADALETSRRALQHLARRAADGGLRLMTENWFGLLASPDAVRALLGSLDGQVGLCLDFGNWSGPTKYDDLAAIADLAESCHAKAQFAAPLAIDRDDYERCLALVRASGFSGSYTLIYDGPNDDEWAGIAIERDVALPYTGKM